MRWSLGTFIAVVVVVGVAAYAVGAGRSANEVTLCASKSDRSVTLGAKGKCPKGAVKVTVAKEGPAGPAGPKGLPGDPGAKGAPGSDAVVNPEAMHYVVSPGSTACQANPGTFCKPANLSGEYQNFAEVAEGNDAKNAERVGYYKDPSDRVHLTGTAGWFTSGGSSGGFVPEGPFYLPVGYRPAHTLYYTVPSSNSYEVDHLTQSTTVEIRADGLVYSPGNFHAISLDAVSFRP